MTEDMERQLKRFDLKEPRPRIVYPSEAVKQAIEDYKAVGESMEHMDRVVGVIMDRLAQEYLRMSMLTGFPLGEYIRLVNTYWDEATLACIAADVGLVSRRVLKLTTHKRYRVAINNMNRIRRTLALYQKRHKTLDTRGYTQGTPRGMG